MRAAIPHSYWTLPRSDFLGEHPLWDLYAFHAAMLDEGRIGDYLMSLHMEEFLRFRLHRRSQQAVERAFI